MTFLLKEKLQQYLKRDFELRLKDNRSTFIHVSERGKELKVHLHDLFLEAPDEILSALARYLARRDRSSLKKIREFAENRIAERDYSKDLDLDALKTKGKYYDLGLIYSEVNRRYFDNSLNLYVTWFKKPVYRKGSHLTFGAFDRTCKLIKINELLDDPYFPSFFVSYVVFHEMLHATCPIYYDEKGIKRTHSKFFKEKEKCFDYYSMAKQWEKSFKQNKRRSLWQVIANGQT